MMNTLLTRFSLSLVLPLVLLFASYLHVVEGVIQPSSPSSASNYNNNNSHSVVPANIPLFGNGYPLSLQENCDYHLPGAITTLWTYNKSSSEIQVAAAPANCIQIWHAKNGSSMDNVPTLWQCRNPAAPVGNLVNYHFSWNESSSSFQQHNSTLCMGYVEEEPYSKMLMYNCSKGQNWFRQVFTGQVDSQGNPVFQLFTPGSKLCLGTPQQYMSSASMENKQWKVTFGLNGIDGKNYTYLQNLQVWQPTFNAWSINLLDTSARTHGGSFSMTSLTSVNPSNSSNRAWHYARGGRVASMTSTEIVLEDIQIGDVATEKWTISLVQTEVSGGNKSTLSWAVDRTYVKTVLEETSRYPTMVLLNNFMTVGQATIDQQAMFVSTLDTSFQRNETSVSGFYFYVGEDAQEPWVYANSQKSNHWMTFSPADLCIPWSKSVTTTVPGNNNTDLGDAEPPIVDFSFQWYVPNQYPLGYVTYGLITTNKKPRTVVAGTNTQVTLSLTIDVSEEQHETCEDVHSLSFSTGNKERDESSSALARLFFMWAGNVIGNSPSSVICVFESSMFPLMASIFDPPAGSASSSSSEINDPFFAQRSLLGANQKASVNSLPPPPPEMPELFKALRYELNFILELLVNKSTGEIGSQWDELGPIPYAGNSMWQQQTSLLYAVYVYATTTGDKTFIEYHWDGALKRAMGFLLNELGLVDNLMHCINSWGNPHPKHSCNWLDIIGFGYIDGIVNSEAAIALQGFEDMALWLGDVETSRGFRQLWQNTVRAYNERLWNETLGLYSDWIGLDGKRHSYAYIWQQGNAANNASGIVGNNQTRLTQMCDSVDKLYERLYKLMNTTNKTVFATPTNFIYVPYDHQTAWHQHQLVYENGALFVVQVQFEMQLRYSCNQPDRALKLYDTIMEQFRSQRCWGQHYHWSSEPVLPRTWQGGDVLTDTTMIVVGLLRGGFRIQPTLTNGILINGDAGAEYEGFTWTFYHMGKRVTATVKDGKTVITPAGEKKKKHKN